MKSASALLAAILASSGVIAHPLVQPENTVLSPRQNAISGLFFKSRGNYTDSTEVIGVPLSWFNPLEAATRLIKLKEPYAKFRIADDSYASSNGITHVHFKQTINDIDVDNADYKVNVRPDGRIFSYGGNFINIPRPVFPGLGRLSKSEDALRSVVSRLTLPISASNAKSVPQGPDGSFTIQGTSGALTEPTANLVYFQTPDGKLQLTWKVETDILDEWLISYINAEGSGEVLAVNDYVTDATYNVYKWPINDPTEGVRTVETDPFDRQASKFTWEGDGTNLFTDTRGNNGKAQANLNADANSDNDPRPESPTRDFNYPYNTSELVPATYLNASVTQLWYTANMYHDLLFHLGFTPAAGNFENNNDGKGGKGNDAVILNAQDGAGKNNANFATPPDGRPGRMRMYIWKYQIPYRDGSFEAGIVLHEYTHGLSNRLTGGPANSNCLALFESRGMGEGWSDFFATAVRVRGSATRNTDYSIGAWAANQENGIRQYKYSTSLTTNPLTFKDTNDAYYVHQAGTIWCAILYEVLWNLIDARGNTDAIKPKFDRSGVPTDGKYLTMKLVLDGLALQICNPGFLDSRDAILDADRALTGGKNICLLWKGFAKRGLGQDARRDSDGINFNGFKVPRGC